LAYFTQVGRLLRITQIFVKHDLEEFIDAIHLFRPHRLLLRLLPWRWFRTQKRTRGERLRCALEELGPVFVKFGQVLSTHPDLLPEDIASELSKLQDKVPAFSGDEAVAIIEEAYDAPMDKHLVNFNRDPIASASVAQVHFAQLGDGTEVAVKVLRPGIEDIIERDIQLLYTLARLAMRFWEGGRRLRPVEVIDEFNKTIHDELDLRVEAANASQLRSNFVDSDIMYVPKVYWDHCRRKVMVMERIHGIPISDIDALKSHGIDLRQLAHNGVEIFFTQAFRDGFFHADMHPGNIFVAEDGQYRAVDFGIMGTLGERDKRYLAENFLAFFNRDYHAVAEAHLRAGWVPAGTRVEDFETAIRSVCEPIFAKPIKDISFGRLLLHLFQTARKFDMEIQPQLVLLQKTLFNIEGLGRQLYPELDLWETAKPYLEQWMRQRMGPKALFDTLKQELPKWWQMAPEFPSMMHQWLRRDLAGERQMQWRSEDLQMLQKQNERNFRKLFFVFLAAIFIVSGAMLFASLPWPVSLTQPKLLLALGLVVSGLLGLLMGWPRKDCG
jgi:ubiquinone biosynthesis protein